MVEGARCRQPPCGCWSRLWRRQTCWAAVNHGRRWCLLGSPAPYSDTHRPSLIHRQAAGSQPSHRDTRAPAHRPPDQQRSQEPFQDLTESWLWPISRTSSSSGCQGIKINHVAHGPSPRLWHFSNGSLSIILYPHDPSPPLAALTFILQTDI